MNEATVIAQARPWWMRAIFGKDPRVTLVRLLLTVVAIIVLFKFVLVPIEIVGMSMEPSYVEGRRNLINHLAYMWENPKRGDVVAVRTTGQNYMLLKRIIGLPGDHILNVGGYIWVNGELLEEPYVKFRDNWQSDDVVLDEDFYYLIGDNRKISAYGKRHARQIVGKVVF